MTIGIQRHNNIGGPTPTGKWVDTRTGTVQTVKTMVDDMSGNGSTIMFVDGDIIPFSEFSMYYIQESDADEVELAISQTCVDNQNQSNYPNLDRDLLTRGLGPVKEDVVRKPYPPGNFNITQTAVPKVEEISKQKQLLIDLFNKIEEYPTIDVENILIKNIPVDAIKTLHDYFDVTVDDIVDILIERCIDKSALRQSVINNITSILN